VLLYLFKFTNNTLWTEIVFYIYWSPELVCQQVVQKKYNRVEAPEHRYVTMAKHNSNACLRLYQNNSSVHQPDSQVNNCLMCPPWTWTTAFIRGRRCFWHATHDCVAPYVDIILHRGRFWAKSAASGRTAPWLKCLHFLSEHTQQWMTELWRQYLNRARSSRSLMGVHETGSPLIND